MNKDVIGQTILKQFRVDAFVESGGMAAVYKAWDLKRNVYLAMKVLHADLAEEPAILKRFKREANALKKLTHPHIVPFYGLYQSSDYIFLLERFIDGDSLKDILRKKAGKPFETNETLIYLKALCACLGYAHANNIVHCDVKPGNVMVDLGGSIYLTDFGIARYSESTTTSLGTIGTAAYMAPEQIRGETVSAATDVYALGVMLFELMTGRRPFHGTESTTEQGGKTVNERIRYGHLFVTPPNPRSINPAISDKTAQVILRALSKKSNERFQSTGELLAALCRSTEITVESIPDRIMRSVQPPIPEALAVNTVRSVSLPKSRKLSTQPGLFVIIGAIVLMLLGVMLRIGSANTSNHETNGIVNPSMGTASLTNLSPTIITRTPTPLPTITATPPVVATKTSTIILGPAHFF